MLVQPYSPAVIKTPFLLPTPQGCLDLAQGQPRPRLECCLRQHSGQEQLRQKLFRKKCLGCSEALKQSHPAPHIQYSGALIWLTGDYALWRICQRVCIARICIRMCETGRFVFLLLEGYGAAIFDHTVRGVLSQFHNSRALGLAS